MASEFDLLVHDLARLRGAPRSPAMPKSISIERVDLRKAFAHRDAQFNSNTMIGDLKLMTKAIGARMAANRAEIATGAAANFFKSLGRTRAELAEAIRAGRITADEAIQREAQLNSLLDRARTIIGAEGGQ